MVEPRWVLTPLRWLRKMWLLLRELRTHEQRTLTVRDLVVRELRQNALTLEEFEQEKWALGNLQAMLSSERWTQYAAEWSALRQNNQLLWREIAEAYEAMQSVRTKGSAARPPSSWTLRDLADRLSEAHV